MTPTLSVINELGKGVGVSTSHSFTHHYWPITDEVGGQLRPARFRKWLFLTYKLHGRKKPYM